MEERAREALADWLGTSTEKIEVIKVEQVEWPDTSLGCPEPGMVYAQVIVPGCRVVMRVDDEVYEYHLGGRLGVLCDGEGQPLVRIGPGQLPEPIGSPTPGTQTEEETMTPEGLDSTQFIFIEVQEDLVSQGATYPPPFVPPNDFYAYDPTSRTLLVRTDLAVNENVQAIVGKVTAIYLPTRSYSRGALFLFPVEEGTSLPVEVVELHDDGSALLAYEDTTFTLLPEQERTFKSSQGGTGSSQVTKIVTITNYGLHEKSSIVHFDLTTR